MQCFAYANQVFFKVLQISCELNSLIILQDLEGIPLILTLTLFIVNFILTD